MASKKTQQKNQDSKVKDSAIYSSDDEVEVQWDEAVRRIRSKDPKVTEKMTKKPGTKKENKVVESSSAKGSGLPAKYVKSSDNDDDEDDGQAGRNDKKKVVSKSKKKAPVVEKKEKKVDSSHQQGVHGSVYSDFEDSERTNFNAKKQNQGSKEDKVQEETKMGPSAAKGKGKKKTAESSQTGQASSSSPPTEDLERSDDEEDETEKKEEVDVGRKTRKGPQAERVKKADEHYMVNTILRL